MRRDELLKALFPPDRPESSREEYLRQLEEGSARFHELVKKTVAALSEKERRVLALRFSGDGPEDERGRELLREVEQDEKGSGYGDQHDA